MMQTRGIDRCTYPIAIYGSSSYSTPARRRDVRGSTRTLRQYAQMLVIPQGADSLSYVVMWQSKLRGPWPTLTLGKQRTGLRVLCFLVSELTAGISCCSASSVPGESPCRCNPRCRQPPGPRSIKRQELDGMILWWSVCLSLSLCPCPHPTIVYFSVGDQISTSFFAHLKTRPSATRVLMHCTCQPEMQPPDKPRKSPVKQSVRSSMYKG
ncbi:hypothetical protein BKA59DRAFT_264309 [Fusarium tricinctum]|uniref:Uncharacterized protein n=1 Tax=Fusarium tricinctum TaxID=61284 RepID=A0A8K0RUS4_9HYPO|nr:hypothetical protein BKA59DRAFT_264309 [Fusarium tricinctum]